VTHAQSKINRTYFAEREQLRSFFMHRKIVAKVIIILLINIL